jgi:SNF family Na+-dependent transporter
LQIILNFRGGVVISGRIAIFTSIAPYILLLILLMRGLFLDGAMKGLYYLFVPEVKKLFDPLVWVDAAN